MSAIKRMRVSISYATQSGIQSKETFDTANAANAHLDALRELARIAAVDGRGEAAAAVVEEARRAVVKDRAADGAMAPEDVPSDLEMLDWLERNATSGFSFDLATLTFRVPEQFEGSSSLRELIRSAMAEELGENKTE
ncbi:hypothetical protein [Burkholderia multivorans]|uniref:hypothetical protein n=1 Tax=Burkholderia multivorans TaxID=87883 RepID=UPI001588CEEE|nr:hypothetical protein [Burkholderia multivorans]MDR8877278.1 hypothetical protein [Burkholderia multivorans]MDR8882462.1 hypothetical protein [Burkholderia multivorans]MDR8889477.1 hypothetical protein [Burkholderia multivorans]MDR8908231.1 hypothetical protein [Burkholderia multivorans]MDR8915110.1 hypothetical protein [Burkholderia multivorans]